MATQLFFVDNVADNPAAGSPGRGQLAADTDLRGSVGLWGGQGIRTSRGSGSTGQTGNTITGPTAGIEIGASSTLHGGVEWVTEPLAAAVTISGTVTFNIWALETAMTTNAGLMVVAERLDSVGAVVSTIVSSARGVELATAVAANNWTATPTSTSMVKGDRIRVRIAVSDAGGTMAAVNNGWSIDTGGTTAGADGDSYIQFTEAITFLQSDPAGSKLYLTNTAASGGINPGAATEKEGWTSAGAGSVNGVTSTTAGPTDPIQVTATGGGTAIEWYSRPLSAVTLAGMVKFNVRAKEDVAGIVANLRGEVALCANDGTLVSVWGASGAQAAPTSTTDAAYPVYVAGDDLSITAGQRLRFRLFIDDGTLGAMVTGHSVTVSYNGATAAAAGDTFVVLPVTVTESTSGTTYTKAGFAVESA